jgi:hypothetical protein
MTAGAFLRSFSLVIKALFGGAEILFANAAELTYEILGKILPFGSGLVLVVNPAANIANVLHKSISFRNRFLNHKPT